jgi:farnesyl-diphosphate farnesyltransferase
MAHRQREIQALLKDVSRSFYLTLRVLPYSIRKPVGIAYMLARAADTIADTPLMAATQRRTALQQLLKSIQEGCSGRTADVPTFGDLAAAQESITGEGTPGERALLERFGELHAAFTMLPAADRSRIGKLLATITGGQESDLARFGSAPERIAALDSDAELDGYTFAVAGCVGEFWTEMCRAHLLPAAALDDSMLRSNGIRFGKGLQLVNILRDLPKDLRRGRCYIPKNRLSEHGLFPEDLLDPAAMDRFRPLYREYLGIAEAHLSAGWQYTTSLPFRCLRLRLACAWPALIGIRTLARLRSANVLGGDTRIKISRAEIRNLLLRSIVLYPLPSVWNSLFDRISRDL